MAEDAGQRLGDVDRKLDAIMKRLDMIEQVLLLSGEYPFLASAVRGMRRGVALYSEPIKALERLTAARKLLRQRAALKDELSQTIIGILALKGPQNISQITRQVEVVRGKASRRIVRERLKRLAETGALREAAGSGHRYEIVE